MGSLKAKERAQDTAINGHTEAAVAQYRAILSDGDPAAAASLAEIEAFRGNWPEVLSNAYVFLRKPTSVYAGNVFDDVTDLVALAGFKTGAWPAVQAEVTAIRAVLRANKDTRSLLDLDARSGIGLAALIKVAGTRGKSPYPWDSGIEGTPDARAAKFEAGIKKMDARKDLFDSEAERRAGHFAYARNVRSHRSAVKLFDQVGTEDLDSFSVLMFTASALSRAGRAKEAWSLVESSLHLWWPVDVAQVAPVVLLTDEGLRPLMTPDRCAWVLDTRRGPAAKSKTKPKTKAKPKAMTKLAKKK